MTKSGTTSGTKTAVTLIAASLVLSAVSPALADHGDRYNNGWRSDTPHRAVEMCRRVAEREASRQSYGLANVTDIRDVRETRRGYEVRGRIAVNSRNWGGYDRNRDGYREHDRGWRSSDLGSFKCRVEYGRIADIDIDGIRGL